MGGLVKDYRELIDLDFPNEDIVFVKFDMKNLREIYYTNSEFERYKKRISNPLP